MSLLHSVIVAVQFEFRSYIINEDRTPVEPFLVLSRPVNVSIDVVVDAEDLSAIGMSCVVCMCNVCISQIMLLALVV